MSKTKHTKKAAQPVPSKLVPFAAAANYDDAVQGIVEPRMTKVSVTVDRGLLSLVDHYVQAHPATNRSEIFDKALEIWAKETQKQADLSCYSATAAGGTDETADWSAIQTEAAKHIW